MNAFLWGLQILLAAHTAMGAVWKFSNSEQTVPSLQAIPHGAWIGLAVLEILLTVALVAPVLHRPLAFLAPVAAGLIAAEMLLFAGVHLASGETNHGPMTYWIVVAAIAAFIAYGRLVLSPS